MRILFVQPRFHTNQHPSIKALVDHGHDVGMFVQYKYINETYSTLQPTVVGYQPLFSFVKEPISRIFNGISRDIWINYSPPPILELYTKVSNFNPDVVILREYSVYSITSMVVSNILDIPVLFYDQRPKYGLSDVGKKKKIAKRIHNSIFGYQLHRITPVKGDEGSNFEDKFAYYTPFVMTVSKRAQEKSYFDDGQIRIISVGKFDSPRKNHLLLLDAFDSILNDNNPVRLTLVGHLEEEDNRYYQKILEYIRDNNLEDFVDVKTNLTYQETQKQYLQHDLFVLPSSNEPAAVSPLEAMSGGLPVICSDSNGTRHYIDKGRNGFVFASGNRHSLENCIRKLVENKEQIATMGRQSINIVRENHNPDMYNNELRAAIEEVSSAQEQGE